jgi:hypothetical protein
MGGGIVADPHQLLVRRLGPRSPLPVHVVSPEEMIRDDRSRRMNDRDDAIERKGLVALEV